MPKLSTSRSAPTASSGAGIGIGPRFPASLSNTVNRPHLLHVYSAQHLDDVSNYHGGDRESKYPDEDDGTQYSDELEQARGEDYDEAFKRGEDEVPEVRMGVLDTRDLEANLEKKQSTKSIKDPNLVRVTDFNLCEMA